MFDDSHTSFSSSRTNVIILKFVKYNYFRHLEDRKPKGLEDEVPVAVKEEEEFIEQQASGSDSSDEEEQQEYNRC